MARKPPFKFDFDEDAEPVEELHRLRVATAKHFKTLDAIMDYCRTLPSPTEMLAELETEIAGQKGKQVRPRRSKATKKPTARRKSATRTVHA